MPAKRYGHTAILDPIRRRILVMGGFSTGGGAYTDVWQQSLESPESWTWLGFLPAGASNTVAIYDPPGDRIILMATLSVGGVATTHTWQWNLAAPMNWVDLTPQGTPPSPRSGCTAVYDSDLQRMLVFGGSVGSSYTNEVWSLTLSNPAWALLTPSLTPPPPHVGAAAIYDPTKQRMIVFGGFPVSADAWALLSNPTRWEYVPVVGTPPAPTSGRTAVFDDVNSRMIVFGGGADDLWSLSMYSQLWTRLSPGGQTPGARSEHSAVFDHDGNRMIIFGGNGGPGDDAWSLSTTGAPAWTSLSAALAPSGRSDQSAVVDPVGGRMIVFGGAQVGFGSSANDTWSFSLTGPEAWCPVAAAGTAPPGTRYPAAAFDPVGLRMILFGQDGALWSLSMSGPATWSTLHATGTPPSTRRRSTLTYDPVTRRMILFGGQSVTTSQYLNDVWTLSLDDLTWTQLLPSGPHPYERADHCAVYDPVRHRLIVLGGDTETTFAGETRIWPYPDAWALSLDGLPAWAEIVASGGPSPRINQSAAYDPTLDRVIIYGGFTASAIAGPNDALWELSLAGAGTWANISANPQPPVRPDASLVYDPFGLRMILFAGGYRNDLWTLRWALPTAVTASVASVEVSPANARIVWQIGGSTQRLMVQRRTGSDPWTDIAEVTVEGRGTCAFDDETVLHGHRYGFRLLTSPSDTRPLGEVWVDIPDRPMLSLVGMTPNPATDRSVVRFSLMDATPARLDVVDIMGRLVVSLVVESLGAGDHTMQLQGFDALPDGVYLLRLRQGGQTVIARTCRLR